MEIWNGICNAQLSDVQIMTEVKIIAILYSSQLSADHKIRVHFSTCKHGFRNVVLNFPNKRINTL